MNQQFRITELIKAIQKRVTDGTGMKCLDHIEKDEESPFYYVEFKSSAPANSKTMYVMDYTVYIHIVTEETQSSVPLYRYIELLQAAMTEDVEIPEPFWLVLQTDNGTLSIYREETDEMHGVESFTFRVSFGFRCKI